MEIRRATAADVPAMVDVMFVEPSREAVALTGSADRARRFQLGFLAAAVRWPGNVVFLAELADGPGGVLGFASVSDGSDVPPFHRLAAMSVKAMGLPGAIAAAWRASARMRVDIPAPGGGLHLVELQVHPHRRGSGIGGELLTATEDYARAQAAPHLSLTTGSANPARRLYARHGFEVMAERSSKRYTRLTGIPGRVLMVKDVAA
jgi:ribosomal protein S18 acetylase RimI-like enzyme